MWYRHPTIVLCAAALLAGGPSLAADDAARNHPAAQADQDIDALLRKIEQQISAGHAMYPSGDCAIDTWKQVLQLITTADSPKLRTALADFTTHMRSRAVDEMTAGKNGVANDMNIFAVQASHLVWHTPSPDHSQIATTRPVPPNEPTVAEPARHDTPPAWHDTPKVEPLASVVPLPPPPPTSKPSNIPGPDPGSEAQPSAVLLDPNLAPEQLRLAADLYVSHGDERLAANDVPAARKFYGYAAMAGSARAAVALAETYNPKPAQPTAASVSGLAPAPGERRPPVNRAATRHVPTPRHAGVQYVVTSRAPPPFFERVINYLRNLLSR
jgi:hypothetical protein